MMRCYRAAVLLLLLVFAVGCRSPRPAGEETADDTGTLPPNMEIPPGITIRDYEGVFRDYRPLAEALDRLPSAIDDARAVIARRTGLVLDPDRRRVVLLDDELEWTKVETRAIGGRMVQIISLPSGALAQSRLDLSGAAAEALCVASFTDPANETLPPWIRRGAPLWVSGLWERLLMERIIGGPSVLLATDRIVPELDLGAPRPDRLSSALFFRFIASEFGADRIPLLLRALVSSGSLADAAQTALRTDDSSLPVAFDGFRIRTVSEITDDPFVRELASLSGRAPSDRIQRLTGLASRAPDKYVGAGILEALGMAQFEADDYQSAAQTLAEVERDYPKHALHPDRNQLYFALTFARREEDSAAALRLSTFLTEFPKSEYAPIAAYELAGILLSAGRTEEAVMKYRELTERFPEDTLARRSHLVLAAYEQARHRYALARKHLESALPDPEAKRRLAEMDALAGTELPGSAGSMVRSLIDDLKSGSPERRMAAERDLIEVGPAVGDELWLAIDETGDRDVFKTVIRILATWPPESSRTGYSRMLTVEDDDLAAAVLDALLQSGTTVDQVRVILESHPNATPAADRVFKERYGIAGTIPGIAGLMTSDNHLERIQAARRLGSLDHPQAASALARLARDPSPQVRRAAAASLGLKSGATATETLTTLLSDDSSMVRLESLGALARLDVFEPIRSQAITDRDARVRTSAARLLLDRDEPEDCRLVISLLADTDGGVASTVEAMLRTSKNPSLGPGLANALRSAARPGLSMRIVRVMAHHTGDDFGFEPSGGPAEHSRVADAFLGAWRLEHQPR